jgi:hypothetical protein
MRTRLALMLSITIAGGVAALAAGTTPALAAPASPACNTAAKIRTGPHRTNTALGVCEAGDGVAFHSSTNGDPITCPSGIQSWIWDNVTDLRTGVTGWVSGCYIS